MVKTEESGAHRLMNTKLLNDPMIKQAHGASSSNHFEEGTKGNLKEYLSTYRSTLGRTQFQNYFTSSGVSFNLKVFFACL